MNVERKITYTDKEASESFILGRKIKIGKKSEAYINNLLVLNG